MTTISLQVAPRVAPDNPRGARAAAALFLALTRLVAGLFRSAAPRAKSAEEEIRLERSSS